MLCFCLIFVFCSCGNETNNNIFETEKTETQSNYEIIGTGSKQFLFTVIGTDEKSVTYTIKTDKQNVAETNLEELKNRYHNLTEEQKFRREEVEKYTVTKPQEQEKTVSSSIHEKLFGKIEE